MSYFTFVRSKGFVRYIAVTCLLMIFSLQSYSQEGTSQRTLYNEKASQVVPGAYYVLEGEKDQYPAYVKFASDKQVRAETFTSWLSESLAMSIETEFVAGKEKTDDLGYVHKRLYQTYKGIPVDRAEYVVHIKDQSVVSFAGDAFKIPEMNVDPGLTEQAALDHALAYIGADKYYWEVEYWQNEIREHTGNPAATWFPEGELIITKFGNIYEGQFRLAYRFDIHAHSPNIEERVYVDAGTGEILYTLPLTSNCEPPVNFTSIFNGTQSVQTEKYTADDYRLNDDCKSAEVWVRDWGSTTSTASPTEIENTTNTWTTQDERFGASVLWETNESYDYFKNVHNRDSYDDANGDVKAYINAVFSSSSGDYTDNASMSFSGGTMKVGLGSSGTLANSWSSIDIIGHEYTHAVTGSSSSLVYQGESGALNESFSDIFGEMIEHRSAGPNDWLMGDDRTNGAIRSISDPKAFNDPDTYNGDNWRNTCGTCSDNGGVHTNSGVMNYWFFLVAMGGSGVNDNDDEYSVSGIGRSKASAIAFRNMTIKLTANSDYADARAGAIEAAEEIHGLCSDEVKQVTNAWYAVGVGDPYVDVIALSTDKPGGYDISCNGGSDGEITLDISGTAPFSIAWDHGPTTSVLTGLSAGTYTVTVTDNTGCSASTSITLEEPPLLTSTTSVTSDYNGEDISCAGAADGEATAVPSGGAPPYSYLWDANAGNQTQATATGLSAGSYSVTVTDANGCSVVNNVTLTEPDPVTALAVATSDYNGYNVSCHGGSDGVAEVTPGGGVPPYTFLWDDPGAQTTAVASGLMAGSYTVVVTDANGCEKSDVVTLTEPDPLVVDAGPNQTVYYGYPPAECADLEWSGVGGGVPPYSIEWSTGEMTQMITVCPDTTTDYHVKVTDANNCEIYDTVRICVIDVRCGNNLNKVEICHFPPDNPDNPYTLCVGLNSVEEHLSHGDSLAACGTDRSCPDGTKRAIAALDNGEEEETVNLIVFPNPFNSTTTLQFFADMSGEYTLRLMDYSGNIVSELFNAHGERDKWYQVTVSGSSLAPGIYLGTLQKPDGSLETIKIILDR